MNDWSRFLGFAFFLATIFGFLAVVSSLVFGIELVDTLKTNSLSAILILVLFAQRVE